MGRYAPVVDQISDRARQVAHQSHSGWSDLARAGRDPQLTGKPPKAPPCSHGIQALGMPESPVPSDPDSRYWLDLFTLK